MKSPLYIPCIILLSLIIQTPSKAELNLQELFAQGNSLFCQKNYESAAHCYKQALNINNGLKPICWNLAITLTKLCEWNEAIEQYKTVLQHEPNNTKALYSLAHALKENQQPNSAIEIYKKLLKLEPGHQTAHFELGLCYLIMENFTNGWPEFELGSATRDQFPDYHWKNTDLTGKTVLIRAHWGLGDMIQFIRYAQLLKQHGAAVILQAYPELEKLLSRCPFLDSIIPTHEPMPPHDLQIPLMSLMNALEATAQNIPQEPYVFADPNLVKIWKKKLSNLESDSESKPFRIGICWSGRGAENVSQKLRKNITLSELAPIAELENVKLYSLQKVKDVDQLSQAQFFIHDFGPNFDNANGRFMDTAAVMKNLDLVITVDTSIAHLAGALGVPFWVLLPWTADWRWFMNRNDSPWYPTAKLFRQSQAGEWQNVVQNIAKNLERILATHTKKESPQELFEQAQQYQKEKNYQKALTCFKKLNSITTVKPTVWFVIGNLHNQLGQPYQAIPWYRKYLAKKPNDIAAMHNAALALRRIGEHSQAVTLYKKALELKPDYKNAHFGLGQAYLMLGDLKRGLPEFERGRISDFQKGENFLTDISQINGNIIMIRPDWGLGDMLQFIRYAKLIKKHGGTVWVHPHGPLADILRSCPYIDKMVDKKSAHGFDKEVSPMSLPYIFKTTIDTVPDTIPYLYADPGLIQFWDKELQHDHNFKIGICWEGSTTALYPRKDVPLTMLQDIAKIPGISLYSLQKMNGTGQLDNVPFTIHQFGPDFDKSHGRFMDTAAVMKNLDLVLTVDTSIGHLAGALGIPVWVFLPYSPDWRWMVDRNDTPWYPTMQLFRQKKLDDWTAALQEIKCELKRIMKKL